MQRSLTGENRNLLAAVEDVGSMIQFNAGRDLVEMGGHRGCVMDRIPRRSAFLYLLHLNVGRNRDMCDSSGGQSCPNCKVGYTLHVRAIHDALVVSGDVDKELVESDILLGEGTDQVTVLQTGDGENRSAVQLRVIETIQKVNSAGTGGRDAHPESTGELGIGAGHECRGLFVPNMDEPDPIFLFPQSLEDPINAVAGQTEHGIDTPRKESLYEYI